MSRSTPSTSKKRSKTGKNRIRIAIETRSLEDLVWGYLFLSYEEIRDKGSMETFKDNNIKDFIAILQKLESEKPEERGDSETLELQAWIDKNK
jgi:hypothetical protein|tara:strand:- start:2942 stop:3220 length:279 start_codon:yes stop_codon:yes gene_type:complete